MGKKKTPLATGDMSIGEGVAAIARDTAKKVKEKIDKGELVPLRPKWTPQMSACHQHWLATQQDKPIAEMIRQCRLSQQEGEEE